MRFREEEPDDEDLKEDEDTITDVVLPACVLHSDRVDELIEESGTTSPSLEDRDTLCPDVEWEQFDEIG